MSQLNRGEKCPVCNSYLFDEDDVVFCPVCGAPHHRACYQSIGHCAHEQTHGTPEQYTRPAPNIQPENQQTKKNTGENSAEKPTAKQCPRCGALFFSNQDICPRCGQNVKQPVDENDQIPFTNPMMGNVTFVKIDRDEPVTDGVTAGDIADYTGPGVQRYFPLFKKISQGKKTGWNWAAFLFPQAWFFYRKMYFAGTLSTIVKVLLSVMVNYSLVLFPAASEAKTYSQMYEYFQSQLPKVNPMLLFIPFLGIVLSLIFHILCGLFGDKIYFNSAIERIKAVKSTEEYAENPQLEMRKKGWVNLFLAIIGIFAVNWVGTIILAMI